LLINGKPVQEQPVAAAKPPAGADDSDGLKTQRETNPEGRSYVTQVYPQAALPAPEGTNADNTIVYTVPAHCYFMMGDNRDDSLDSRFDPQLVEGDPKLGDCGLNNGLSSAEPGVGF